MVLTAVSLENAVKCMTYVQVDTEPEKAELLSSYKTNQATKDCKYFMNGEAECPFG